MNKNILVGGMGVLVGLLVSSTILMLAETSQNSATENILPSRAWMEYAQNIVRTEIMTPPESARLYSYVATAYHEALVKTQSEAEAGLVVRDVINKIVPTHTEATNNIFEEISKADQVTASAEAMEVQNKLFSRLETDGKNDVWAGERPSGDEYWTGENPFEPNAKNWEQWIVEGIDFEVSPPPVHGGPEHQTALRQVKEAAVNRTPEQGSAVNFWGGVPGTEAPAGIWQNVFYTEVKDLNLTDEEYAFAQMILAQAIADSFIECWTVKYTYWTRRPTMDDSSITPYLEMNNPNFPSYVSGHSTVSRAAAGVLSVLFPDKSALWLANASEARDSRLWAGIHFPYDNEEGFLLGEAVAAAVIEKLSLQAL